MLRQDEIRMHRRRNQSREQKHGVKKVCRMKTVQLEAKRRTTVVSSAYLEM